MSEQKSYQDKIIVRDLLVHGVIGIYPEERTQTQPILINLVVTTDITRAAETEELAFAVNYHAICKAVIARIESGSDLLVEKLALDLARMIILEFEAAAVMVRVEKPEALDYTQTVGVEIERTKADFA